MHKVCFSLLALVGVAVSHAKAVTNFTEDFTLSDANWKITSAGAAPNYFSTGGPDNSAYISNSLLFSSLASGATTIVFRGQDGFDSSSDQFVGNWISDGVTNFSIAVRNDSPVTLTYFVRFATSANSPAVSSVLTTAVTPGAWTTLNIPITPSNSTFTLEGNPTTTYNSTFSAVGNLQVGFVVPSSLAGTSTTVKFDLDKPTTTVVPEPAAMTLLGLGLGAVVLRRRRSS